MDTIMQSLAGLDNFALYFGLSIVFLFIFKLVYALVTPHDEWKLVKEEKNVAAAIGFGGAIIGFAIALGSAASNSVAIIDFEGIGISEGEARALIQRLTSEIISLELYQIVERSEIKRLLDE